MRYTEDCVFYAVEKGTKKILNYRLSCDGALEMMKSYPNAELVVSIARCYENGVIKVSCGHCLSTALMAANEGIENSREFLG